MVLLRMMRSPPIQYIQGSNRKAPQRVRAAPRGLVMRRSRFFQGP